MSFIQNLGQQVAGEAVGGIMGLALGGINDQRQYKQQKKLQKLQLEGQREMALFNYEQQMKMWEATNYKAQMEQLKKAGLNPGLMYGMGGGGGATTNAAQGAGPSGANAPTGGGEAMGMALMAGQTAAQTALLKAQKENIEADTANKTAGTGNIQADTENKILEKVIIDYMGKEAADQYNKIKSPNRGVEAKTYEDELAARQGIAGTIYELWTEGKLKDKSVAEIESILLQNAKTREETRRIYKEMELLEQNIKGAKLDNIISGIEAQLQQETGIDKNANTIFKILGRLFGYLMPKTR